MHLTLRQLGQGLVSTLLLSALAASPARSQDAVPVTTGTSAHLLEALESLESRTTRFSDLALSPDGRHLVWQATKGSGKGELFLLDRTRPGAVARRLAVGSNPTWSGDSRQLAYLADPEGKGQEQLWIVAADGGQPKAVSNLQGSVALPRWSPDGRSLACLHTPGAKGGGPLGAAEAQLGEIQGVIHNQRIAVVDSASGALHFASPEQLHVYAYDWSPDSRRFALTAAAGPGDNNWWIAQLYLTEATSGAATSIYKPQWQIAIPRWSPDGQAIAFIEGLMSDEGFHGGDLMVVPATGGPARNLTPGRPTSPSGMLWLSRDRVLITETAGGGSAIAVVDLGTGAITERWHGDEALGCAGYGANFTLAADGTTSAIVREGFDTAPEVWTGPIGQWKATTRENAGVKPLWGRAENITWRNEGQAVQGWLIHPKEERPGQRQPMVVEVHGGPSGAHLAAWDPEYTGALSLAGYFVLLPNPRGSYGQGEAFTQANRKDFGGGDLRDILAGVDKVLATYPVDPRRLGVKGWSYGGYLTMWAVTQTNRFAAAVAGAGVANWKSYYGQNAIDQWMIPFFGASVYDDPAVYAKSSPIEFIKQVRTPTLVIVGERDAECPAPQSFEFWHALKAQGVPAKLVVYPGEGHMFVNPLHRRDRTQRTLAWLDQFLNPGPAASSQSTTGSSPVAAPLPGLSPLK